MSFREGDLHSQARGSTNLFPKLTVGRDAFDAGNEVAVELYREFTDRRCPRRAFARDMPFGKYLFDVNLDELVRRDQVESDAAAKIGLQPIIV